MKLPSLALLLCLSAPQVWASSASISLSGRVLPGTCSISNASQTVLLDDIRAEDITNGNNGLKAFSLGFNNCMSVLRINLSFSGVAETADNMRWKNTAPTSGAAKGIALALLGPTGDSHYLYHGLSTSLDVTGSTATYQMRAGYHRNSRNPDPVAPGAVTTQITVNVTYQ